MTHESVIRAWARTGTIDGLLKAEWWAMCALSLETDRSNGNAAPVAISSFYPIFEGWLQCTDGKDQVSERIKEWIIKLKEISESRGKANKEIMPNSQVYGAAVLALRLSVLNSIVADERVLKTEEGEIFEALDSHSGNSGIETADKCHELCKELCALVRKGILPETKELDLSSFYHTIGAYRSAIPKRNKSGKEESSREMVDHVNKKVNELVALVDEVVLRQIESDKPSDNSSPFQSYSLRVYAEAISLMRLLHTMHGKDAEMRRASANALLPRVEQILHTCNLLSRIPGIDAAVPGSEGMSPTPHYLHYLLPTDEELTAHRIEEIFIEVLRTCSSISNSHETLQGEAIRIAMNIFNMIQNIPSDVNIPSTDHTAIYIAIMKCVRSIVSSSGERTPILTRVYKGAIRDPNCNDKKCAKFLIEKRQSETVSKE